VAGFLGFVSLLTPHLFADCSLQKSRMRSVLWICAGQRHGRRSFLWKLSTPSSSGGWAIITIWTVAFSREGCRDRRKLTFYFIADKRIDFRELVRELFRYVSGPEGGKFADFIFYILGCSRQEFGSLLFRRAEIMSSD